MSEDIAEIDDKVRKYRAIIVFANQRTGSTTLVEWFSNEHKKYIDYDKIVQSIKDLGYDADENDWKNSNEIFDIHVGVFKNVILEYQKNKDVTKLELAIKTIMSFRPTFKIINEHTDIEVIKLIAKYINYYHYSAIFLHRRKTLERLLSLWFFINYKDSKENIPAIDVNLLIEREKSCIKSNKEIWEVLRKAGCRYVSLSFEDLYSNMSDSTILHISFRYLFYNIWDFTELKENGKLNLNKYYYKMKGIEKLKESLNDLERPTFSNMHVEV